MRLRTFFRISPAVWLTLPALILSILYMTKATYPTNYGVAATAGATSSMAFLVGFVATTAAWEAARLRRGGIWAAPHTRSRLEITITAVTPSILLGAVFLLGTVVAASVYGQAGLPEIRMVVVGFIAICAWSLVGFLAGLRLPMSVALPSMLLAPFLWFAFVPALPVEWLRQLSGMYRDCCRIGADIAHDQPRQLVGLDKRGHIGKWHCWRRSIIDFLSDRKNCNRSINSRQMVAHS